MKKRYFEVNVKNYKKDKDFCVYRPASLNNPKDSAVMFVTKEFMKHSFQLQKCENCLVFWPEGIQVPEEIQARHAIIFCENPHTRYCQFFCENNITYLPKKEEGKEVSGAWIASDAKIGKDTLIFPGAYISGESVIGDYCYIGSGVKLIGKIFIGNHVVIRENTVIGADGLSTDRNELGKAVTMPQFGGVRIKDGVQIGANTTISRGAIDDTVIYSGVKIDNSCFISHNVKIGEDTFIVGESILFGSVTTGKQVHISGNATIRNGISIGDNTLIGMGAVVVKDVPKGLRVKGNPAK